MSATATPVIMEGTTNLEEFRNHYHNNPCKNGGLCANSTESGFHCLNVRKEGYFGEHI